MSRRRRFKRSFKPKARSRMPAKRSSKLFRKTVRLVKKLFGKRGGIRA